MTKPPIRSRPAGRQPQPPTQPSKGFRRGKLAGSLIGLSSAAVMSIYTLGYLNTRSVESQFATANPSTPDTAITNVTSPPASSTSVSRNVVPTPTPAATPSSSGGSSSTGSPTTAQSGYKDGTYTGSGNSRHGGIDVSVVIQNGQIASIQITGCHTRYSCADVDPLVNLIIQRQTVPAAHVSGATDSSSALRQAVSQALQQASTTA